MRLYIHWLEMSGLLEADDIVVIADLLNIPVTLLKGWTSKAGTTIYTLDTPSKTESVYIRIPKDGYGRVSLRGSFFDDFPDQSIQAFRDFMFDRKGNCLRLDNSFKDTDGHLDCTEYKHMSLRDNYQDYCSGSTVANRKQKKGEVPDSTNRQGVPDVHQNHRLIHYGNADAKQYVKFYECPDGFCKLEWTGQDKAQNNVLLSAWDSSDMTAFNELAKSALVKAINFVTPASKRAKRPSQVVSFRQFLGSEITPIRWTDHCPARQELTKRESFDGWRDTILGQLWNGIARYNLPRERIEAITQELERVLVFPEEAVF